MIPPIQVKTHNGITHNQVPVPALISTFELTRRL